MPRLSSSGSVIVRRFVLRSERLVTGLWLRAAVGDDFHAEGEAFAVEAAFPHRVRITKGPEGVLRSLGDERELIIPVEFAPDPSAGSTYAAEIIVEVEW